MDGIVWSLAILTIVSCIFGLGALVHLVVETWMNRKEKRRAAAFGSRNGLSSRVVVLRGTDRFRERAVRSGTK